MHLNKNFMNRKRKKMPENIEQCSAAHTRFLTGTFNEVCWFLICAKAQVMTEPDSSLFLWLSSASLCLCNYPFFSILFMLVATWLLRASDLPGVQCLVLSVSPACTEDFLSTADTADTTRHPNTLVKHRLVSD